MRNGCAVAKKSPDGLCLQQISFRAKGESTAGISGRVMTPEDVIFMAQQAIEAMVHISLPILLTSLIIGLVVTIIQALTQIQDPNLQFTPKILGSMIAILTVLPYVGTELYKLTFDMFQKVVLVGMN